MRIKEIEGYSGYFVTDTGEVIGKRKKGLLKQITNKRGYKYVTLCNKNGCKNHLVHRLVAKAFLDNPYDYSVVNHKDENPSNNNVENLEWCTQAYNNAYGTRGARTSKAEMNRSDCSIPVVQFDLHGRFIAEYPSSKEAWRKTGISRHSIIAVCNHKDKYYSAKGFLWAHIEETRLLPDGTRELLQINNAKQQKPIYQYDLDGNFIKRYISAREAATENGICAESIQCVARNERKTYKRYIWRYERDEKK